MIIQESGMKTNHFLRAYVNLNWHLRLANFVIKESNNGFVSSITINLLNLWIIHMYVIQFNAEYHSFD